MILAQAFAQGDDSYFATLERNDLIDVGIAFEQRRPARFDHPCEAALREAVLQAGGRRQGVDHVAQGTEADDQNSVSGGQRRSSYFNMLSATFATRWASTRVMQRWWM